MNLFVLKMTQFPGWALIGLSFCLRRVQSLLDEKILCSVVQQNKIFASSSDQWKLIQEFEPFSKTNKFIQGRDNHGFHNVLSFVAHSIVCLFTIHSHLLFWHPFTSAADNFPFFMPSRYPATVKFSKTSFILCRRNFSLSDSEYILFVTIFLKTFP